MKSSRHLARVAAMQALFSYELHDAEANDVFAHTVEAYESDSFEREFSKRLFDGVMKNLLDIREKIQEFAPEFPIDRLMPIDRAVLEIGVYEMLFEMDTPPIVAIDEAIEIAKSFGDLNSSKFVNGVLSSIMQKYCKDRDPKTGLPYGTEIPIASEKDQNKV